MVVVYHISQCHATQIYEKGHGNVKYTDSMAIYFENPYLPFS